MADTTTGGPNGTITLPANFNAKMINWSATINATIADITGFHSKGYREKYPHGPIGLMGSAQGIGLDAAGNTIEGDGGTIDLGAYILKFDTWDLTLEQETTEITGLGDYWRKHKGTVLTGYGSATGMVITENAPWDTVNVAGDPINNLGGIITAITLTANAGLTYTGYVCVSNLKVNRTVFDKCTGSFDFVFSGRPTQTWAGNSPLPTALLAATLAPSNSEGAFVLGVDDVGPRTIGFPGIITKTRIVRSETSKCDIGYEFLSTGEIELAGW